MSNKKDFLKRKASRKNGGKKEGKNGEKKKIKKNNEIWKKVGTDSGKHRKPRTKKGVI